MNLIGQIVGNVPDDAAVQKMGWQVIARFAPPMAPRGTSTFRGLRAFPATIIEWNESSWAGNLKIYGASIKVFTP
ncbi:MAG TPA: hypothetical protein VH595_08800 [Verrucomicrobiae bacterium]|jgi:hypothetical protein|nr:hypothetical protein [Verrucomicrobiae bacterium]